MNAKVMVVDDNPSIRETVQMILETSDYETHSADSGESCLEQLRGGFRGVILMDYMMPGLNGYETLKAMVDEGLAEGNVVCMLTAMHEPTDVLETMPEFVLDYIRKPFTMSELLETVEDAISFLEPESGTTQ